MNYDTPRTTSTTPPNNTLRTRRTPSRHIDSESYGAHTTAASSTTPLAPYRPTAAPLPRRHLSRANTAIHDSDRPLNASRETALRHGRESQRTSSNSSSPFWDSPWSSFQDLASQLFNGSDGSEETVTSRPQNRKRRPFAATHDRITSAPPAQWGPSGSAGKSLGKGSKEDRLAHVQAKKREGLLAANGHVLPDTTGRFKRRGSDEIHHGSAPPAEETEDRDALVYLHPVKPQDTLAGVMIKYNCEPNVFRKANRLWPNDSIQIRKVVMLPVEACGVKGRKLPDAAPTPEPSIGTPDEDFMPTPTAHRPPWPSNTQTQHPQETPFSSIPSSPSISVTGPPEDSESPWKHDSWVTIDGFASPVEIARLPRRTLGFFPRSRRKSQSNSHSHSDLGNNDNSSSLPPSSLDLHRLSLQSTSPRNGNKSRSSSTANYPSSSLSYLHGPGGVGTLGKDVRGPGPAPDGLNKLFAAHLPNLVAPRGGDSFESQRSSLDHSSSSAAALGSIENVGGAIEGWVRKMAGKAAQNLRSPRASMSRTRERWEEEGEEGEEAIELTDAGAEDHQLRRGGRGGEEDPDEQQQQQHRRMMMEERFPPRGRRVFEDSGRKTR